MNATAADYTSADLAYIDGHRFMYGELGQYLAAIAILYRDQLLRPNFVLPVIRLAPVAPYGHCMALAGNSASLNRVPGLSDGVWLYLHQSYYGDGNDALLEAADATVLHELLHDELFQRGEDPRHKGQPWATRCQELSDRLGITIKIERPRSRRIAGRITTATPDGCLPYLQLRRWPHGLMEDGPPLPDRVMALPAL